MNIHNHNEVNRFIFAAESQPINIQIINWDAISPLSYIEYQGRKEFLGEYRNLREDLRIDRFLSKYSALNIAAVNLKCGEILNTHVHPFRSMIIIISGCGQIIGDSNTNSIGQGDVILIPAGHEHGFIGKGPDGFQALSFQFDGLGLYSEKNSNFVIFKHKDNQDQLSDIQHLLDANQIFEEKFK